MGKVKLTSCKQELVRRQLDRLGLDVGGTKKDQVERLRLYYEENQNRFEIAGCDVCDGDSDAELDACPFCGETGVLDGGVPVDGAEPVEESPLATVNVNEVVSTEIITIKALDEQIGILRKCQSDGAANMHRIGTAFKIINDQGLWKMRMGDNEVSRYKNFGHFCTQELGVSKQHVYRCINVADRYTEEEVRGLSANHAQLILRLPKEIQAEVLQAAKDGEGTTALSDRAAALQGDRAPDDPPPANKAVTLAVAMGIQKVPLYKRPKGKNSKVCDPETAEQATSISECPWLAIELRNKVRLLVRLEQTKDGHLQASVEFSRGEPVI